MKSYRYLGFFSLFAFFAVPGLLAGEWGQAIWLVWLVWGLLFFVDPKMYLSDDGVASPDETTEKNQSS